jgi:mono/diheme cytochrome c family protein
MIKAVTIILVIGAAVGAQQIKKVPIQSTSAASGREMFAAYCAVCHGTAGKGDGPVAKALKRRPVDLTTLSRNNGGTFPQVRVMRYIGDVRFFVGEGGSPPPSLSHAV